MELKDRVEKFREEFGTPVTIFCKRVEISTGGYHRWMKGDLHLSEETQQRISDYLAKYGF